MDTPCGHGPTFVADARAVQNGDGSAMNNLARSLTIDCAHHGDMPCVTP
jgi:hypothetical protein